METSSPIIKTRRRPEACKRCHQKKIGCSFQNPCDKCTKAGETCEYDDKDYPVTVSRRWLQNLQERVQQLEGRSPASPAETEDYTGSDGPLHGPNAPGRQNAEATNPLLEIDTSFFSAQTSSAPVYIGQASCTFFWDCLLQTVNPGYRSLSCNTIPNHVDHPIFRRQVNHEFHLPSRSEATLLLHGAIGFIGTDYHLCLRRSMFERLDRAYQPQSQQDVISTCHLLAMLALGELYSSCRVGHGHEQVPGTTYFVQAVSLLQDLYESASVEQVQVLTILSFYCNVLGRVKHAHIYCGIAMRLAIHLGLHRSMSGTTVMSPVVREHRRRVWWTMYLFDRLISSKLGYPLAIRDDDIDVEPPSMDGLTTEEQQEFFNPANLRANVRLASITGDILTDLHCLPRLNRGSFVARVHRILNSLRSWEQDLPDELRMHSEDSARNLFSLHLHKNLCIIQTTRSILLHVFRTRFNVDGSRNLPQAEEIPQITRDLVLACIRAARTTNQHLSILFTKRMMACYGYFDAHYLFTSTTVLIVAEKMDPSADVSSSIQIGFFLLGTMAKNGNVSARDYFARLEQIRVTLSLAANAPALTTPLQQNSTDNAIIQLSGNNNEPGRSSFLSTSGLGVHSEDPLLNLETFLELPPEEVMLDDWMEHPYMGSNDIFLPT